MLFPGAATADLEAEVTAQKQWRDALRAEYRERVSRRATRRERKRCMRSERRRIRDSKRARGVHYRWALIVAFESREGRRLDPRDEWSLERPRVAGEAWQFACITAHDEVPF